MSFLIDPPWLYATGQMYGRATTKPASTTTANASRAARSARVRLARELRRRARRADRSAIHDAFYQWMRRRIGLAIAVGGVGEDFFDKRVFEACLEAGCLFRIVPGQQKATALRTEVKPGAHVDHHRR